MRLFLISIINIIREKHYKCVQSTNETAFDGRSGKENTSPDESLITPIWLKRMPGLLLHVLEVIT